MARSGPTAGAIAACGSQRIRTLPRSNTTASTGLGWRSSGCAELAMASTVASAPDIARTLTAPAGAPGGAPPAGGSRRYGDAGTPGCRAGRTAAEPSRQPLPAVRSCACGICSPARSSRPAVSWSSPACPSCATRSPSSGPCARPGCPPPGRSCAALAAGRGGRSASPRWSLPAGSPPRSSPWPTWSSPRSSRWPGAAAASSGRAAASADPDTPRDRRPPGPHRGRAATAAAVAVSPPATAVWSGRPRRRRPPPLARVRGPAGRARLPRPRRAAHHDRRRRPRPAEGVTPMLAVVVAEGVAIALLAVLVLGLLRSHALILRALHELGAGLELEEAARPRPAPARPGAGAARAGRGARVPAAATAPRRPTRRDDAGRRAGAGGGRPARAADPAGVPVQRVQRVPDLLGRAVQRRGRRARAGHGSPSSPRGRSEESVSRLRQLAGPRLEVVAVLRRVDRLRRARLALLRVRRGRRRSPARAPRPRGRRSATSWARPSTTPRRPAGPRADDGNGRAPGRRDDLAADRP